MEGKSENLSFDEEDAFKRKPVANNIIKLFKDEKNFSPILVDAPWVQVKLLFVKNLLT